MNSCLINLKKLLKILRPCRKYSKPISLDIALEFLENDRELIKTLQGGSHGFKRSLPPLAILQNVELAAFMRQVVGKNGSQDDPMENPLLDLCYTRGWLHAQLTADNQVVYVFPTKIHHRYLYFSDLSLLFGLHYDGLFEKMLTISAFRFAEHLLSADLPPFPVDRFSTLHDLFIACVQAFKPSALREIDRSPLEAQYQDELYRACYEVLGHQLYLSSEWTGKKIGGRVDFVVRTMHWAIECLRDGKGIEEHVARFHKGGRYYKWLQTGEIHDFVVLDFRKTRPRKKRGVCLPFLRKETK